MMCPSGYTIVQVLGILSAVVLAFMAGYVYSANHTKK